ncbi:MAG TPA: hypothetical protein VIC32_06340 [Terriglobales bacterium]
MHPLVLGTYPDLARFAFTKLRAEGAAKDAQRDGCGAEANVPSAESR